MESRRSPHNRQTRRAGHHAAGANHRGRVGSVRRVGRFAGIALVLSDRRSSRRRPADSRFNRILRHGTTTGQNAMEPLNRGRLKVAAAAVMTDNATFTFAEKGKP